MATEEEKIRWRVILHLLINSTHTRSTRTIPGVPGDPGSSSALLLLQVPGSSTRRSIRQEAVCVCLAAVSLTRVMKEYSRSTCRGAACRRSTARLPCSSRPQRRSRPGRRASLFSRRPSRNWPHPWSPWRQCHSHASTERRRLIMALRQGPSQRSAISYPSGSRIDLSPYEKCMGPDWCQHPPCLWVLAPVRSHAFSYGLKSMCEPNGYTRSSRFISVSLRDSANKIVLQKRLHARIQTGICVWNESPGRSQPTSGPISCGGVSCGLSAPRAAGRSRRS